jgi:hypothetical protein
MIIQNKMLARLVASLTLIGHIQATPVPYQKEADQQMNHAANVIAGTFVVGSTLALGAFAAKAVHDVKSDGALREGQMRTNRLLAEIGDSIRGEGEFVRAPVA